MAIDCRGGGQMQCPKCGWQNPDAAHYCESCGVDLRADESRERPDEEPPYNPIPPEQPPYTGGPYGNVPDYLTLSILAIIITALCCSPIALVLSVVALVKSSSANRKRSAGYYGEASADAIMARNFLIAAAVVWIVGIVISVVWRINFHRVPRFGNGRWI